MIFRPLSKLYHFLECELKKKTAALSNVRLKGHNGISTENVSLKWDDMAWEKTVIRPVPFIADPEERKKNRKRIRNHLKSLIREDRGALTLKNKKGKVTDCGYDIFTCAYTKIPADSDFLFEADVTVSDFRSGPGVNGQEAFGIFIRDTMERDASAGIHYSNMAAVGGYYGRYNFFGRSGVTADDFGRVSNFFLYKKNNRSGGSGEKDPQNCGIIPEEPERVHLELIKEGHRIMAKMRDRENRDLLAPERNGGPDEVNSACGIECGNEAYSVTLPAAFSQRDKNALYIGFLCARNTEIVIHKNTVRLGIRRSGESALTAPVDTEVPDAGRDDSFPDPVPGWDTDPGTVCGKTWYAAPDGTPGGDGSPDSPLDAESAVRICGNGESVHLSAGHYLLDRDLLIGKELSGCLHGRKCLTGETSGAGRTVLDFGGTDHALCLRGDFWDVRNIRVTNGFGIMVEGSYNRLWECFSYRNAETGILIRHRDSTSPRSEWPGYNIVEDCVSYENRDRFECNADGFACKVASGAGNRFRRCVSWLNSDDGFDLFTKNRETGAVIIEDCSSFLNGYKPDENGGLIPTAGNGNGFKLGGSGMYIEHQVYNSLAEGNRSYGFTCNSNPYIFLDRCHARNNGTQNICYSFYDAEEQRMSKTVIDPEDSDPRDFDRMQLLQTLIGTYDGDEE